MIKGPLISFIFWFRGHNYPVWCVTESSIGLYLATGSRDFTARLWSTDREFPLQTYVGHTQDVDVSYCFHYCYFNRYILHLNLFIYCRPLHFIQTEITLLLDLQILPYDYGALLVVNYFVFLPIAICLFSALVSVRTVNS